MVSMLLSDTTASISELKKNPRAIVGSGNGYPVAILNRNKPTFYCVPAELYEQMLEILDEQELVKVVKDRENQPLVDVDLSEFMRVILSNLD